MLKLLRLPIIIAISKVDIPGANLDKVKQQMSEQGIVPEDWGGRPQVLFPYQLLKGKELKSSWNKYSLLQKCRN